MLERYGTLEFFRYEAYNKGKSNKMIGAGSFASIQSLRNAYIALNDKSIALLASRKMWILPTTYIKYNIPPEMAKGVSKNIDTIAEQRFAKVKMYSENPSKPFRTLRIWGDGYSRVTMAKEEVESILAGSILMDGEAVIWDASFLQEEAQDFLTSLSEEAMSTFDSTNQDPWF